ncbi:MAG: hypothetical protein NTU76_04165 [Candidatus Taylorbacteria bacterium]|nr:hypothetical protein [Candidatus Taylorbacteria bacterium]
MSKYYVNEKFFDKWNPKMAYVLGYLYADGSMEDAFYIRGKYIKVTSIDKDRIVIIKKLLNSKHKIVKIPPDNYKRKIRFLLRIGSHKLYKRLVELGLYPNKSLTIKFPRIPSSVLNHFIRGYFDGDGCVYLERKIGISGELITKRLLSVFTSGSKLFLSGLSMKLIKKIEENDIKIYKSHRSYQLRYSTRSSMNLFKFMYNNVQKGLYMQRKFDKFKEYFSLQPQRINSKIKKILNTAQ